MIATGLCSVTFRQLTPAEIVALVARAGLDGIEWGGDVHAPHGDLARAREVERLTREAGLRTLSYGSYYRVGEPNPVPFEAVLETAAVLGTALVRVWAGRRGSADADAAYRRQVADDARRLGDLAQARGMTVAYELHGGTLTDTVPSTVALLTEAAHPCLRSYWQALNGQEPEASLRAVLPWLTQIHVYFWRQQQREALAEGAPLWAPLWPIVRTTGRAHAALLEFVKNEQPESFLRDAATLRAWLA